MKQSIKIGLIVIAAIAIVALLFFFTKRIQNINVERIVPQSFQKYIENRVNNEIKGKPYNEARLAFYDLIGEIKTESFVWLNDSTRALSDDNAVKCRKTAFYAYAPVFSDQCKSYFEQQSWTSHDADALNEEADALLAYGFAAGGTDLKNDLEKVVKTVREYHEALAVISSASGCGTVEAVNSVISKSRKYYHDPLDNNKKLISDLNHVPVVAKESLANRLVSRANTIINRPDSYYQNQYTNYFDEYDSWMKDKTKYEQAFGANTKLANAKTNLEQDEAGRINRMD